MLLTVLLCAMSSVLAASFDETDFAANVAADQTLDGNGQTDEVFEFRIILNMGP